MEPVVQYPAKGLVLVLLFLHHCSPFRCWVAVTFCCGISIISRFVQVECTFLIPTYKHLSIGMYFLVPLVFIFRCMDISCFLINFILIRIPDEEWFSETAEGCTASYFVKSILCSRCFCTSPLILGSVLFYLRSTKGGCYSIWDDLSFSFDLLRDVF